MKYRTEHTEAQQQHTHLSREPAPHCVSCEVRDLQEVTPPAPIVPSVKGGVEGVKDDSY